MVSDQIPRNRISLGDSIAVLKFYKSILNKTRFLSVSLILLGFLSRVLNVLVFVAMVKVFLSVIDPIPVVEMLNSLLSSVSNFSFDRESMLTVMIASLSSLVIVQHIVSALYLRLFVRLRTDVLTVLASSRLNEHAPTHFNVCIDNVPHGLDSVVKCVEIGLFYSILLLSVMLLNPLLGFLMAIVIPGMLAILVLKGRKEIFVVSEMRSERVKLKKFEDDATKVIQLGNQNYEFLSKSISNAQTLGGVTIVVLMLFFLLWFDGGAYQGITALALVFAIRFAVLYAGEFSRNIGRLLQQRVLVEKIQHNPFD